MKILELCGDKKTIQAYMDGHITISQLMEKLEWYWHKKIFRGTKVSIGERRRVPTPSVLKRGRNSERTF